MADYQAVDVTFHVHKDGSRLIVMPEGSWPVYYSHGLSVAITHGRKHITGTITAHPYHDEQGKPRYGWAVSEGLEQYVPDGDDGRDGMTIPHVLLVEDSV